MTEVSFTLNDNILTLAVSGRVDSQNADTIKNEISGIISSNSFERLILDFENLEYISSAGLRVVLNLKKKCPNLAVVNVSNDIYAIFEATGFTEIMTVQKAYRKLSVEGCKVIGEGAKGIVYRYDDETIVKAFKSPDCLAGIERERELARKAFIKGIPTAISFDIVKVNGMFGSVFELLDAKSMSEAISDNPENIDMYVGMFTDLLKQIHSTEITDSDNMPDIKIVINKWIKDAQTVLSDAEVFKIKELVGNLEDRKTMIHGDYHSNNIMIQNGEAILIDMDTLAHGHPVFELENIYISYVAFGEIDKSMVEKFMGLTYDTCVEFWDKFIHSYVGDELKIEETENKVKLLAYLRMLRHYVRRGLKSETDQKNAEFAKQKVSEFLNKVDTLNF